MSAQHNLMAHEVSTILLRELRTGNAEWATSRLSKKSTLWQGFQDWPKPDIAIEDRDHNSSFALEFKPPNHQRREYITGLGQAITYLRSFEFSGLVVPEFSSDGFQIASYLDDLIKAELPGLALALFQYDPEGRNLTHLRPLRARPSTPPALVQSGQRPFWGYWRDLSHSDVFDLLSLIDKKEGEGFDSVFAHFWKDIVILGQSKDWEGRPRSIQGSDANRIKKETTNASLSLRHAGLLSSDHALTGAGYTLLRAAKIYSADSEVFLEMLAYCVLVEGRHLNLIFWVDEQSRNIGSEDKGNRKQYLWALDRRLVEVGAIRPRSENTVTPFLRDELKLWNKLELLVRNKHNGYFHRGTGLVFNWRKIVAVVDSWPSLGT